MSRSGAAAAAPFLLALLLHAPAAPADGDLVKWRPMAEGQAESKKSGKAIFYFVTADWCAPCHEMRGEVFSDPKIAGRINSLFVPVEVVDRSREEGQNAPEVNAILRHFRVQGFPTVVIIKPGRQDGVRVAGFPGKELMADAIERAVVRLAEIDKAAEADGKRASGGK